MAPVDGKVSLSLCEMLQGEKKAKATQEASEEEHSADHSGPPKKSFQPYHAQSVPKSEDLEAVAFSRQSSGEAVDVTTMMLRNIPNKYTQNSLLQEINELGFAGTFDFFYLPMDVHNRSNVGYAFVNFLRPENAERFRQKFSDHRFQRFQSRKISSVCTAHVQGLHENLRHFQNRAVTHARNDQYRPVVFRDGSRVDIEDVLAEGKTRSPSASHSEDERRKPRAKDLAEKPYPNKPTRTDAKAPPVKRAAAAKGAAKAPDRKGLEDAIRLSLCALQERLSQSSATELPVSPPPGLASGASAADAAASFSGPSEMPQGQEQDVMQLLNLRGRLLDRLLQKEDGAQTYNQATLMAMQQIQEQQYMQMQPTPPMCPMPNPYAPYGAMGSKWEDPAYVELSPSFMAAQDHSVTNMPTPRTNKLMLESSLGGF